MMSLTKKAASHDSIFFNVFTSSHVFPISEDINFDFFILFLSWLSTQEKSPLMHNKKKIICDFFYIQWSQPVPAQ